MATVPVDKKKKKKKKNRKFMNYFKGTGLCQVMMIETKNKIDCQRGKIIRMLQSLMSYEGIS